jgi:hypothetical protein
LTGQGGVVVKYDFLIETYETERIKVISVWSEFKDEELPVRPKKSDPRGRSVHEQMVHQCVSEDLWFRNMLGIEVDAPPLPEQETRIGFMKSYAEHSRQRLAILRQKDELWWEELTKFFDVQRSRAWVMTRRLTHTSHIAASKWRCFVCWVTNCIATTVRRPTREALCRTTRRRSMRM